MHPSSVKTIGLFLSLEIRIFSAKLTVRFVLFVSVVSVTL